MTEEVEDHSGPEETPISEDTGKPKQKRLSPEQWAEIETLWVYGLMKTKAIADKYGVTSSAVTGHFQELKKKGIILAPGAKRDEALKALKLAIAPPPAPPKPQSEFEANRKERIEHAKAARYRQTLVHNNHFSKLQKEIHDGVKTYVGAHAELKAMQRAGKIILDNQTMWENALNIAADVDEQSLTLLEFRDLTIEEIREKQEGSGEDFDGLEMPELEDEDEDIVEEGGPTP